MAGLSKTKLDEAFFYWREAKRNCLKTSEEFGLCDKTITNYRNKYQWVKRADTLDDAEFKVAQRLAVRAATQGIKIALQLQDRLEEQTKPGRAVTFNDPGGTLMKTTQVIKLNTGGPTVRIEYTLTDAELVDQLKECLEGE